MQYEEKFYNDDIAPDLRLGDIVEGCFSLITTMKKPIFESPNQINITIDVPKYFAVMTPCCSIGRECSVGNDTLALAPLIELQSIFIKNPYFREDFTRINRLMRPEDSVSPKRWESFTEEEKIKKRFEGMSYAFLNYFVYKGHDLFEEYELKGGGEPIPTRYYMIDFKRINSIKISPDVIKGAKRLQLSVPSREDLRNKLSNYFGRRPDEDEQLLID